MDTTKIVRYPSQGVKVVAESDTENGQLMDTQVEISGVFCISGDDRDEFLEKLERLIDDYRI